VGPVQHPAEVFVCNVATGADKVTLSPLQREPSIGPCGVEFGEAPSVFFGQHDCDHALGDRAIRCVGGVVRKRLVVIDPMKRDGTESCPP
jgi:hypothetical protein